MEGPSSSRVFTTEEVLNCLDNDDYLDEPICDGSDDDLGMLDTDGSGDDDSNDSDLEEQRSDKKTTNARNLLAEFTIKSDSYLQHK